MPQNQEKIKKIATKALMLQKTDKIGLANEFVVLDEKIASLEEKITEAVKQVKESEVSLDKVLESVKGKDGEKGDKGDIPSSDDLLEIIKPLIPEPIKGKDGKDYTLTEKDKKDIASKINVPIVEKVIIEKPTVTNEIKEVAVYETGEEIVDKINGLTITPENQIDATHIKNLPEFIEKSPIPNGGGWRNLYQMHDVAISSPTNDQVLKYNATTNQWENGTGVGGASAFIDLTDVPSSYASQALKVVRVNAGETGLEFTTLAGGGDALTSDPLSQFASTTSLQLAGVISDETGSGNLVFNTNPTFATRINVPEIKATGAGGVDIHNNAGTQVALFGAGGSTGSTLVGTTNIGSASADYHQIAGGTGTITDTATGSSADININIVPKGTGRLQANGVNVPTVSSADSLTNKKLGSLTTNGFVKTSGGDGTLSVDTNSYQILDATLTALAGYNTNGILTQTAADTFTGRTITGTANQISVTNGDGVSGNPTLSLPADVLIPTVLTVPNTGLHILDTNATHDLIVAVGSNLTADRTLTVTTGNTDMILDLTAVTDEYVLAYDTATNTWRGVAPTAGGSGITIGTTTITSGTNTRVLFNNSGVVGEYTISGTGNVAMTTSPSFTTPSLGVATATTINGATITSGTLNGTVTGTNTGDQTSIVGITGTKAQFDTAVTDGNFLYVGDVTQYTDEMAQDATGAMVANSTFINLAYNDATPSLTASLSATGTPSSTTYLRGDNTWATIAGGGDVSKVGTPVNNQMAVWTGDGTLEGTSDFTYDGTSLNLITGKNFQIAGGTVLSDSAGTLTLSGIDALDATTESTIEGAIDTLANLTSIQGRTVTLTDDGEDKIFGWDDSAGAYENLTTTEVRAIVNPPLTLWDFWTEQWIGTTNTSVGSGPFVGAAISSGTNTTAPTNGTGYTGIAGGGVFIRSSATANSGFRYQTTVLSQTWFGTIAQKFRFYYQPRGAFANVTVRAGFLDTTTSADATDGVYFELDGSGNANGKTANNTTRSTTGTAYAMTINTQYVFDIEVNSAGTEARYRIYAGNTETAVYDQTLSTNIPTTSARGTGTGFVGTQSVAAATDIGILYALMVGTPAGFERARGTYV
jgi:hypothetical protein